MRQHEYLKDDASHPFLAEEGCAESRTSGTAVLFIQTVLCEYCTG